DQKKALPKRFYVSADIESFEQDSARRYAVVLDGKRVRTPGQNTLAAGREELARAIALEWAAQGEYIDPSTMPLTRLINSALDGVAREMQGVAADAVKYAGSDLMCYRAGEPEALEAAQRNAWDDVIAWIYEITGVRPVLAQGVMFVAQDETFAPAFAQQVARVAGEGPDAPLRLAALHSLTTLTGSAFLALAVALGRLDALQAWSAAHVDEDFQMRIWGEDAQAMERRVRRWRDMEAAAQAVKA
ncbi:MAG: ATPase, partial [Alphaproteobacteria bacterium]|nr:ATPase [Alphaproteobacteria bacterium]